MKGMMKKGEMKPDMMRRKAAAEKKKAMATGKPYKRVTPKSKKG